MHATCAQESAPTCAPHVPQCPLILLLRRMGPAGYGAKFQTRRDVAINGSKRRYYLAAEPLEVCREWCRACGEDAVKANATGTGAGGGVGGVPAACSEEQLRRATGLEGALLGSEDDDDGDPTFEQVLPLCCLEQDALSNRPLP